MKGRKQAMKTYTLTAKGNLRLSDCGALRDSNGDNIMQMLSRAANLDGSFLGKVVVILCVDKDSTVEIVEEDEI